MTYTEALSKFDINSRFDTKRQVNKFTRKRGMVYGIMTERLVVKANRGTLSVCEADPVSSTPRSHKRGGRGFTV